jgi:hypothetical protein
VNVRYAVGNDPIGFLSLCHMPLRPYLRMGRRGPFRVREFVRVRWPFTGSPRRWRMPL